MIQLKGRDYQGLNVKICNLWEYRGSAVLESDSLDCGWRELSRDCQDLPGQRCQRLAAVPDLTWRALVAELGQRGVVTSYGSVWRIVRDASISFNGRAVYRWGSAPTWAQNAMDAPGGLRRVEQVNKPVKADTHSSGRVR